MNCAVLTNNDRTSIITVAAIIKSHPTPITIINLHHIISGAIIDVDCYALLVLNMNTGTSYVIKHTIKNVKRDAINSSINTILLNICGIIEQTII